MTIDAVALQRVLDALEALHERCVRGVVTSGEASAALAEADRTVLSLLPADSDVARLFDRRVREAPAWWTGSPSGPGYVDRKDCANITAHIDALREAIQATAPRSLQDPRDQIYFQEGEVFRARQELFRLLRRATRTIDVADPYLDAEVFDYVDSLDASVLWRLLLKPPAKGLFQSQLRTLVGAGRELAARTDTGFHDRFLILDGAEVWHLGASLKDVGRKAFMMNRVVDVAERTQLVADFEVWWNRGGTV